MPTVTLGIATETDRNAAGSVAPVLTASRVLGQATEADSSFALTRTKTVTLSLPSETDTPLSIASVGPTPAVPTEVLSGANLNTLIAAAAAGTWFRVHAGTYAAVTQTGKTWPAANPVKVTANGGDTVVIPGVSLTNVHGLEFRDGLTISAASTFDTSSDFVFADLVSARQITIQNACADWLIDATPVTATTYGIAACIQVLSRSNNGTIRDVTTLKGNRGVLLYGGFVDPDVTDWVHDITIDNLDASDVDGDCIQATAVENLHIIGGELHDPRETSDHNDGVQILASRKRGTGIAGSGWGVIIDGTEFHAGGVIDADQGIILAHVNPAVSYLKVQDVLIQNVLVHHWRGTGLCIAGTINCAVVNSTSMDNGSGGTVSAGILYDYKTVANGGAAPLGNVNFKVFNSILHNRRFTGGIDTNLAKPAFEDYNCYRASAAVGVHDKGNTNPLFADTVDYRLQSGSPCRNAGIAAYQGITAPTTDFDGGARSNPPDMGKDEF